MRLIQILNALADLWGAARVLTEAEDGRSIVGGQRFDVNADAFIRLDRAVMRLKELTGIQP